MHVASTSGHVQAWVVRHFLEWHMKASQKSQTAPTSPRPAQIHKKKNIVTTESKIKHELVKAGIEVTSYQVHVILTWEKK